MLGKTINKVQGFPKKMLIKFLYRPLGGISFSWFMRNKADRKPEFLFSPYPNLAYTEED